MLKYILKGGQYMNIATIGTSWITESFISAAKKVEGIKLYAVYSRSMQNAESFAEKNGAEKYYSDLGEMLSDKNIDSVYIASPNVFHYEQSKVCLLNGKHVIVEKPATATEEQMRELSALAESLGLVYCEAIMSVHTSAFETLKKAISETGLLRTVNLNYCQLSSKYPLYTAGKNPNIFNPEMQTGCLMDIGVYNVYLAAALFGMPDEIMSSADFLKSGADSNGCAILKYKHRTVTLIYSKIAQNYSPSEFAGDLGTVSVESVSQLTGIKFITKTGEKELVSPDISRDDVMKQEAAFFLDMVNSRDFTDERYVFARETAFTVRRITDIIRKQNRFPF